MSSRTIHDAISSSYTDPKVIQEALDDILRSGPFRTTRQCQDFLRYVVGHTLSGENQLLRERIIGIEVFGRKPDYDTAEDPIVRIRAADLRKRLAQYYQSLDEKPVRVRINVPSGSYRATFECTMPPPEGTTAKPARRTTLSDAPALPVPVALPDLSASNPAKKKVFGKWIWIAAPLVLALSLTPLIVSRMSRSPESAIDLFWFPLISSPKPVLVCLGTNAAYYLSDGFLDKYKRVHHLAIESREFYPVLAPGTQLKAEDVMPAPGTFVDVADAAVSSQAVALLTRHGKAYQQRYSSAIPFADLRQRPVLLVGGFNNNWTMDMTSDLRFVLAGGERIEDRQDSHKAWSIVQSQDDVTTDDYAIIARLLNSKTGDALIIFAGIGQYGTQAAGEFLTDPQTMARLAKSLPPDWNKKNMQLVLHTKVVHREPSTTEIVATYFW